MSQTVLLIEDNDQNRYLLTYLLERNGFTVVAVPDGRRGLNEAQAVVPDVVLLDIQLPVMHGYEVAQALRAMAPLRDVPIVAVTSHAMLGDREEALAAGCTGYIEKPIDPDSFIAEICGICGFPPPPERLEGAS